MYYLCMSIIYYNYDKIQTTQGKAYGRCVSSASGDATILFKRP